ncbi:MAG: c-type cytochrome [Gammaproteobacteria bacterium]
MASTARLLLILFTFFGCTASMADIAAIAADCDGCHGADGVSEWSDMPTIAGISEFVLSDAMFYYRDGERSCVESEYRQGDTSRPATDMCKVAQALSEDDIDAISAHYAELPFKPAVQEFDTALAATGKALHDQDCENCHADSGRDPEEDASILAGQRMGYMRTQFADYLAGNRSQPEKMEAKMKGLSEEDTEALLNFYASLQ